MTEQVPLTLLYVPADRPDRVAKALDSLADVVLIDLEDAVTPAHKDAARSTLGALLPTTGRAVQIRINADETPWAAADVAAVADLPITVGVRIPKCESVDAVRQLARQLPGRALHLLVESALGIEYAFALAACDPAVRSIGLGEADLLADLRAADPAALGWARGRIVTAAAAAGLPSPTMSIHPDHRDLVGLRRSCMQGRALGFLGRAAIHPVQLPVIAEVFRPTAQELAQAQAVIDAAGAALRAGRGAVALPNGKFVDAAVVRQARTVVALAERTG